MVLTITVYVRNVISIFYNYSQKPVKFRYLEHSNFIFILGCFIMFTENWLFWGLALWRHLYLFWYVLWHQLDVLQKRAW